MRLQNKRKQEKKKKLMIKLQVAWPRLTQDKVTVMMQNIKVSLKLQHCISEMLSLTNISVISLNKESLPFNLWIKKEKIPIKNWLEPLDT
jgi:hypothetical protein